MTDSYLSDNYQPPKIKHARPRWLDTDEYYLIEALKKLQDNEITQQIINIESSFDMFGECYANWLDLYAITYKNHKDDYQLICKFKRFLYNYSLFEIQMFDFNK